MLPHCEAGIDRPAAWRGAAWLRRQRWMACHIPACDRRPVALALCGAWSKGVVHGRACSMPDAIVAESSCPANNPAKSSTRTLGKRWTSADAFCLSRSRHGLPDWPVLPVPQRMPPFVFLPRPALTDITNALRIMNHSRVDAGKITTAEIGLASSGKSDYNMVQRPMAASRKII